MARLLRSAGLVALIGMAAVASAQDDTIPKIYLDRDSAAKTGSDCSLQIPPNERDEHTRQHNEVTHRFDETLEASWEVNFTVASTPPGAEVFVRLPEERGGELITLGPSPLTWSDLRVVTHTEVATERHALRDRLEREVAVSAYEFRVMAPGHKQAVARITVDPDARCSRSVVGSQCTWVEAVARSGYKHFEHRFVKWDRTETWSDQLRYICTMSHAVALETDPDAPPPPPPPKLRLVPVEQGAPP